MESWIRTGPWPIKILFLHRSFLKFFTIVFQLCTHPFQCYTFNLTSCYWICTSDASVHLIFHSLYDCITFSFSYALQEIRTEAPGSFYKFSKKEPAAEFERRSLSVRAFMQCGITAQIEMCREVLDPVICSVRWERKTWWGRAYLDCNAKRRRKGWDGKDPELYCALVWHFVYVRRITLGRDRPYWSCSSICSFRWP